MFLYTKTYKFKIIVYFCIRNDIISYGKDKIIDGCKGLA